MATINVKPAGSKGTYSAYGGCLEFLQATNHQVFIYGGTGTGKTVSACHKLLMLLLLYPGAKALFTRTSYRDLLTSGVETFENVCKMHNWEFGKKAHQIQKMGEREPDEYLFPYAKAVHNGRTYEGRSRILLASLSKARGQLGAEYDYIYVNQPELSTEEDWQFLVTRANGRRGGVPQPMLWGDPNPEHERHWIKLGGYTIDEEGILTSANGEVYQPDEYKVVAGKFLNNKNEEIKGVRWRMIKSTFKDNPTIWDHRLNCYTIDGERMMGYLETSLNKVMAARLIEGDWCSFEGRIFEDAWNREKHVRPRDEFEITDQWERYWAMDFGYDAPACVMFFAKNPDPSKEQYVCYKYLYETNNTIYELAQKIRSLTANEPRPKLFITDRNPESVAILTQELGMNVIPAKKGAGSIKTGINVLVDMLKNDEIIILEDSCMSNDVELKFKKHPVGFEEEVENYRWNPNRPDEPIGEQDHAIDTCRYLMTYIKASQRIVPFIWQ